MNALLPSCEGVRLNLVRQEHESQRGQVRVTLPGGRQLESVLGKGSVAIGARTMQEGGAFGRWSREQVRLFLFKGGGGDNGL